MEAFGGIPVLAAAAATTVAALALGLLVRSVSKRTVKKQDTGGDVPEDRIARQGFAMKKVPKDLDVIIIGSGVSGLTTGAILAKSGKTCLVLEQHDTAGGNLHTFEEQGYEFDTGLHYIGGKVGDKSSPTRKQFDYITDESVEWAQMADHYDIAVFGKEQERFGINKDMRILVDDMIKKFPHEEKGIREFFAKVRKTKVAMTFLFVAKLLPPTLRSWVMPWIEPYLEPFYQRSSDVINSLVKDEKLRGLLGYSYGDFGELPSKSSWAMQSTLWAHFNGGGYFPEGGPELIPRRIVRTIEKHGGKVLVRAPVDKILIDEKGTAYGVVCKGKEIRAPMVISSIGCPLTYNKLVPSEHKHRVQKRIDAIAKESVASEISLMSLFVGLKNNGEDLKLPRSNLWVFPNHEHTKNLENYKEDPFTHPLPAAFISFSSSKDPTYKSRRPGKDVALIIGPGFYDHVEKFKDGRVKHRGDEYQSVKDRFRDQMMKAFLDNYPHLEDKIDYVDVGTACTNDYYLGTNRGAVYGLCHTPERYRETTEALDVRTPIKGLYMTGQDVLSCGITGALASGYLTSAVVEPSFLFGDFRKVMS